MNYVAFQSLEGKREHREEVAEDQWRDGAGAGLRDAERDTRGMVIFRALVRCAAF